MIIEHIAFNVADPVKTCAWYCEHLGLRIVRKIDVLPHTHFLADSAGKTVLEVYGHTKATVPPYGTMEPLSLHIAFVSEDVAADRERLLKAGASPAGEITTTDAGDVMTFVRDPWGLTVQFVKRVKPLV